ncbi:MAG: Ca2+-dependent phosphoinositide-specific phospholipase C [Actinomycetota bacterium]
MRLHPRFLLVAAVALAACSGDDDGPGEESAASTTTTTQAPTAHPLDDTLRLHQVQVLGSHNSYKTFPYPEVMDSIRDDIPATVAGLEYGHRPLAEQFDALGVRQIELDVWTDPEGGRYANPQYPASVGVTVPDIPEMHEPGFKVLHAIEFDTNSICPTFVLCLEAVREWSQAHPGHVPIVVLVEVKDEAADAIELAALDAEIRSVFAEDEMVTPDDVRGPFATLGEAVTTRGWPTLHEVRGQIVFALDNGALRDVYRATTPSLEGRALFTPATPGAADAAFAKLNDPIGDRAAIQAALAANMLVRTRADADTVQSRTNDPTTRDAALASGAQLVSTDYMEPYEPFSSYSVEIPGGTPARCNPITGPPACGPTDVEDPDRLD